MTREPLRRTRDHRRTVFNRLSKRLGRALTFGLTKPRRRQFGGKRFKSGTRSREVHLTCRIQYEFDKSGEGRLSLCNTPITVYPSHNEYPLRLIHHNLLRVLFHDTRRGLTVCLRVGSSFEEWLGSHCSTHQPIKEYVDKDDSISVTFVGVQYRRLFSEMIDTVSYIHDQGFGIESIGEDNLCFVRGKFKFWRLNLVESSTETQADNFRMIGNLIDRVLGVSPLPRPADISNLLELLRDCNPSQDRDRVRNHLALMEPVVRLDIVDSLYEPRTNEVIPWNSAALAFFKQKDLNNWDVKYAEKMVGPIARCFEMKSSRYPDQTATATATGKKRKPTMVVADFMLFMRNITRQVDQDEKEERRYLEEEKLDGIIFWAFGDEIMTFWDLLKEHRKKHKV